MKSLKKLTLLLFVTCLISSCSKNDDDSNSNNSGDDFFTAKVDGTSWEAFTGPPDTVAWNEAHAGLVVLQGSNSNGHAITMNIMNYNGVGTYNFASAGFAQFVIAPTQSNSGIWISNAGSGTSGSVEITAVNGDVIEGTVSFVGVNPQDKSRKAITEGKFRATKQ
ncbi:hypothetical protein OD91_1307 [Lutibacter sp. Hel_I_33_5]|uniref:DUF6252 family protein n=1 Tax=Lutibacter sp. Hel_I_33_5 TaxID=1566289 RepID=UPI0011A500DA|nr:DUF6252 family protein [Lutibacter sp. Hel_I_33_5]TVZ56028.1 hypothetical protein OD91_1307 [Lutibacter sp. Hel_I_33_5]